MRKANRGLSVLLALTLILSSFISNLSLASAKQEKGEKVEDLAGAVVWLSKKVAHGTKVTAVTVEKDVLEPVAVGAKDAALLVKDHAVCIVYHVSKGVIYVSKVVVRGAEGLYEDVLTPFYTEILKKTVYEKGLRDGVYKLFLKPVAQEVASDAKAIYKVVLKGVVYDRAVKPTALATAHGVKVFALGTICVVKCLLGIQHQQRVVADVIDLRLQDASLAEVDASFATEEGALN